MSMLDTLQLLRRGYGATMNDDECVELLNHAAWLHKSEGYGLSHKASGTHGVRYDGEPLCHDVLMWKDGTYWDCLNAAGAASVPTWPSPNSGRITDPNRYWVAPVVPQGDVDPDPPTPPPSDLEARVTALEQWAASFRVKLAGSHTMEVARTTTWPAPEED